MQRITPFLWFDTQAGEAAKFYVAIFENSRITRVTRYDDAGARASGRPAGSVMTVAFELAGQEFVALNGGPVFKFNESISFVVHCATQAEVDRYWQALSAGGQEVQCGWLKDKFGVSWQVMPTIFDGLLSGDDAARAQRVMQAMLQMLKPDIQRLQEAAARS
jgi:predicted 3-demethylubiquinone-9 3-methyltransferase (glyoxalase superfamily)